MHTRSFYSNRNQGVIIHMFAVFIQSDDICYYCQGQTCVYRILFHVRKGTTHHHIFRARIFRDFPNAIVNIIAIESMLFFFCTNPNGQSTKIKLLRIDTIFIRAFHMACALVAVIFWLLYY